MGKRQPYIEMGKTQAIKQAYTGHLNDEQTFSPKFVEE